MKKLAKLITLVVTMCMIFSMATVVFADVAERLMYMGQPVDVTIAGNTEKAYYAYGVGGTVLTIEDEDAYVIYGGQKYEAVDGVVAVEVTAGMGPQVDFTIGNSADVEKTFSVDFVEPLGSMNNPEVFKEGGLIIAEIAEGNSQGYLVKFIAPADGVFGFGLSSAEIYDEETEEIKELGWTYVIDRMSESIYGDRVWSDDEDAVT